MNGQMSVVVRGMRTGLVKQCFDNCFSLAGIQALDESNFYFKKDKGYTFNTSSVSDMKTVYTLSDIVKP